jgi:hypothetical protein
MHEVCGTSILMSPVGGRAFVRCAPRCCRRPKSFLQEVVGRRRGLCAAEAQPDFGRAVRAWRYDPGVCR